MWRYLLPAGIFVTILVFLALGLGRDPTQVPSPLINKPAPPFVLSRVEDPTRTISHTDLAGHVSLVNVWATWCVSCREEHLVLLELARSREVPIYGLDYKDSRDEALAWLREYGNPYTAVPFDADGRVAIDWGVYGTPETFLVDKHGIIRYKHVGPMTLDFVQSELRPIIEQLKKEP